MLIACAHTGGRHTQAHTHAQETGHTHTHAKRRRRQQVEQMCEWGPGERSRRDGGR